MKKGYRDNCSTQIWKCDEHPSISPIAFMRLPIAKSAPPSSFASLLSPCARFPPLPSAAFVPTLWLSSFPPDDRRNRIWMFKDDSSSQSCRRTPKSPLELWLPPFDAHAPWSDCDCGSAIVTAQNKKAFV